MLVHRLPLVLRPNPRRVLFRPFGPSPERCVKLAKRVLSLSEEEVGAELERLWPEFRTRHHHLENLLAQRFEQVHHYAEQVSPLGPGRTLSRDRKLLVGACFTQEYALESTALFNPSIVWHPDQGGVPAGGRRFILSLRATGEGHISSITFRTGTIDAQGQIQIDAAGPWATAPQLVQDLSQRAYELEYTPDTQLDARVVFPYAPSEANGMEDARFVELTEGSTHTYAATFTAWDGRTLCPKLLTTGDFLRFRVAELTGPQAENKGMALFPRQVRGRYAMLSRQDGESLFLMLSDDLLVWHERAPLLEPTFPWELVQLGNCGAPVETSEGWLVLTHGVGPMRKYSIGAILLDLDDPTRVIGRLREPLLSPNDDEREGYVPNVLYTCGYVTHGDQLVIPYAMADSATTFATVSLPELLDELRRSPQGTTR